MDNVIANPHSLSARKALADEWQREKDPRAQFISDQIDAFEGRFVPGDESRVRREIRRAIKEHGREWAGEIADIASSYEFELGLVDAISITAENFVAHGPRLVKLAPLVHVTLWQPGDLGAVADLPALSQLRSLAVGDGALVTDAAVERLAASRCVQGIRGLDLQNGTVTERGLQALVASPNLPHIMYINLTGNPCTECWPRGMRVEQIGGRYYLVGKSGYTSLDEARAEAAMGYSPDAILWPPPASTFSYEA